MSGILIPQIIYVGDEAEYLYPISQLSLASAEIVPETFSLASIVQNEMMTVTQIGIKKQSDINYLSISFVPWKLGQIDFPSLVDCGIKTKLPSITVSSITEYTGTQVIQPMRNPLLIPGTMTVIYGALFAFGFIVFLTSFVILLIRKKFFVTNELYKKTKRVKQIKKTFKQLHKMRAQTEKQDLWIKTYEFALRTYFQDICNESLVMINSLTYSQLLNCLKKVFDSEGQAIAIISKIIDVLELKRFARENKIERGEFEKLTEGFLSWGKKCVFSCEQELELMDKANEDKALEQEKNRGVVNV